MQNSSPHCLSEGLPPLPRVLSGKPVSAGAIREKVKRHRGVDPSEIQTRTGSLSDISASEDTRICALRDPILWFRAPFEIEI